MGMESGPEFISDRIEKKEILREVQGQPTEPTCLRKVVNTLAEKSTVNFEDYDEDVLVELGRTIAGRPYPGKYILECQVKNCERVYDVDTIGALEIDRARGVCFETAVVIGKYVLPNPDEIY